MGGGYIYCGAEGNRTLFFGRARRVGDKVFFKKGKKKEGKVKVKKRGKSKGLLKGSFKLRD
jgi:hypothetical protein